MIYESSYLFLKIFQQGSEDRSPGQKMEAGFGTKFHQKLIRKRLKLIK